MSKIKQPLMPEGNNVNINSCLRDFSFAVLSGSFMLEEAWAGILTDVK
jgi:hypothetical protein